MKVLAIGATGTFAGLVVPALVAEGHHVRALVHDPRKAELALSAGAAETVGGDLADRASLDAAVEGMDGVFLITPAFHPEATKLGLNVVEAATAAGVEKVVYNGVYHPSLPLVNHATTRPVESALYAAPLDFTVLQPAMYLQALDAAYHEAAKSGRLVSPWSKDRQMTYVDYRDVAAAAALAFNDPRLSYGTFELAAGGMVTRVELAAMMSRASGRQIAAADMPSLPSPAEPAGLGAMFKEYDDHGFRGGSSLVLEAVLGRKPRSVADYVAGLAGTVTA